MKKVDFLFSHDHGYQSVFVVLSMVFGLQLWHYLRSFKKGMYLFLHYTFFNKRCKIYCFHIYLSTLQGKKGPQQFTF